MSREAVFDATTESFEESVVGRSEEELVLVDFWAPWCGPCRSLSPVLDRLADKHAGQLAVAKVNIDEEQTLAYRFSVASIPAVKLIRRGQVVAEFVGARPESEIENLLRPFMPSEADALTEIGGKHAAAGEVEAAEEKFRAALELDARQAQALLGLARIHVARGEWTDAEPLLHRVPPNTPEAQEADRELALVSLAARAGALPTEADARAALQANPRDSEARYALGLRLALSDRQDDALQTLFSLVTTGGDIKPRAQEAMIQIFGILGPNHELVRRWRPQLASALY